DLAGMAIKLLASVPVAVDNFVEDLGLSRVLGTSRPGTFGLGGLTARDAHQSQCADEHQPHGLLISRAWRRQSDDAQAATS
ncbi:hypothetical protein C6A85_08635, partial [Mycobacterium sp. ITM-2017-0098]